MPLVNFEDKFKTHISEMDAQHQKWFNLINKFDDAVANGESPKIISNVIDELANYSFEHLNAEEKLLELYNYPELDTHKSQHAYYRNFLRDLKDRYISGKLILSMSVLKFLKDWLYNHILETDKKYSSFLKSKGIK